MEDSKWVDKTLELFRLAREDCGCDNVGIVIQSYLYRSEKDVQDLLKDSTRIRLCKGAYKEPEELAYPKKSDVDASYDRITDRLIEGSYAAGAPEVSPNGKIPPIPAQRSARKFSKRRLPCASLRSLRQRMVSVFHPQAGRTPG
jgi:proline dehydrogenase